VAKVQQLVHYFMAWLTKVLRVMTFMLLSIQAQGVYFTEIFGWIK
jgi:hypothetical protein